MKTHKDILRKNWYLKGLVLVLGFVVAVALTFLFCDERWFVSCIIVFIFLSNILFPINCPKCKKSIYIRPGAHAIDNLNFCQACGFDLNAPSDLEMKQKIPNQSSGLYQKKVEKSI